MREFHAGLCAQGGQHVPDINPADITFAGREPDTDQDDVFDDESEDQAPSGDADREGLPTGYRMRADAHYVDQLSSRRAVPEAGRRAGSGDEPSERDQRHLRVAARLAEGVASISAAASVLAGDASPLARRLNTDLIRAEAWRASWLLRAARLVEGDAQVRLRPRPIAPILEALRQGLEPECRMAGVTLRVFASDWNASAAVDEEVLLTGLSGAILSTLGLVGRVEGTTVRLDVESLAGDVRTIEVSQQEVSVPASASRRFFEVSWTDRPGGWFGGVAAAATQAAARLHRGDAVLLVGDRRGTTVRLTLPAGGRSDA